MEGVGEVEVVTQVERMLTDYVRKLARLGPTLERLRTGSFQPDDRQIATAVADNFLDILGWERRGGNWVNRLLETHPQVEIMTQVSESVRRSLTSAWKEAAVVFSRALDFTTAAEKLEHSKTLQACAASLVPENGGGRSPYSTGRDCIRTIEKLPVTISTAVS